MKTLELMEPEKPAVKAPNVVQLPLGLLGFERLKKYILVANPAEDPFQWLQMAEAPKKSFLVVSPFLVAPDYQPDISPADVQFLGLIDPTDALVLNICTVRPGQPATINLKGPIVFNRHTMIGKQCIPDNAAQYPLDHPLPTS